MMTENKKQNEIVTFLKKKGLTLNKGDKVELINEKITDFLKTIYEETKEIISEHRKKGKDRLIQELQIQNAIAKQKIAIATNELEDIQKYVQKIESIKKSMND